MEMLNLKLTDDIRKYANNQIKIKNFGRRAAGFNGNREQQYTGIVGECMIYKALGKDLPTYDSGFSLEDLKLNNKKIMVIPFTSLTTDLCKKYRSNIILRGLRAVSDFEYEFQLAGMNRKLNQNIETIFLMSDVENQIISSRFVKEIVKLKGDIKKFTTKSTIKSLKYKYE